MPFNAHAPNSAPGVDLRHIFSNSIKLAIRVRVTGIKALVLPRQSLLPHLAIPRRRTTVARFDLRGASLRFVILSVVFITLDVGANPVIFRLETSASVYAILNITEPVFVSFAS